MIRIGKDALGVAQLAASDALELVTSLLVDQYLVHLSLTGGTVGIATIRELVSSSGASAVDWSRVHIWWGDERFVERASNDRNCVQAYAVGLKDLGIPVSNIHEFPAFLPELETTVGSQLDSAVEAFELECLEFADADSGFINFDLTLLGVGPDGHVDSLFPERPLPQPGAQIHAEHDSPKPPKYRLTFSYEAIRASKRVWITAAGSEKAHVVTESIARKSELPVGLVSGILETRWYIDQAIADQL